METVKDNYCTNCKSVTPHDVFEFIGGYTTEICRKCGNEIPCENGDMPSTAWSDTTKVGR